jgi:hypothetical protein
MDDRRPAPVEGPVAPDAEERHQRFTLIEFIWDNESGVQPVILASRTLLH